jgi:NADH dehydrogenase
MILVAGATGVLGSEIVRRLRQRGDPVRALVRPSSAPEKVAMLERLGAQIVRGDLKDRGSLDAATRGVSAVITTVTTILTSQPGDSFDATDGVGTRNLIDAATAARVSHFVFVSFDTSRVPESPLTAAKRDGEDHLKRSGLTYTILQPGLFMESWLGPFLFADPKAGTAKVYGAGTEGIRYVAVGDVAEVAVRALTVPTARNATIRFGGPDPLSQRDAVRMFEKECRKPFAVTDVPEQALEAQWQSARDPFEKTFAALMLGVARGLGADVDIPSRELAPKLTPPREFIQRSASSDEASPGR